ncbi:hypothetical protein D9O40_03130 [Clostridium autoethanogenum]|uniref:Uncharacterized protein n=1 Tax=Clostridium autoethanogenum TaxID=84023 RepID=A0A3M0T0C4_9CLOT|nr:hypothetical protein [Clostridium autoethanogenum]RMD04047.1 hypothetical protein D9O40_03130 [Clostridium autoethanogenum]
MTLDNLKSITYPVKSNNNSNIDLDANLTSNNSTYTLRNALPSYSYNPDNRCVAVATAMLLSYYAKYWPNCSDYVDNDILKYATRNNNYQKAFTDELIKDITNSKSIPKDKDGNYTGIDPELVPSGVNRYLVNYRHAKYIIHLTFIKNINLNFLQYESTVINALQNDKPILLGLNSDNGRFGGSHAVTAWGYSSNNSNKFFIINDGGGNDFTYVSPDYVMNLIY